MNFLKNNQIYQINNLKYNLKQLIIVSFMMLMAVQMLALVVYCLAGNIKPILLDRVGANAKQIALVIGTIPQLVNLIVCPIISTMSDKTRSRFGRRMPYLIITAPLITITCVLIAYAAEIGNAIAKIIPSLASYNMPLIVMASLILFFQLLYLFPGSVVYYLIADVIPKECIGRYMSISTILGSACNFLFNFFIFKFAVEHVKITFIVFGVLYLIAYLLLFIFVKEGEYPPITDKIDKSKNTAVKTYEYLTMFFRQCFQHKIFIFLFICTGLNNASTICRLMYNVLFATKDIGMSSDFYGKVMGIGAICAMVAVFFLGKLMDKTHPMLIYFLGGVLVIMASAVGYFFINTPKSFAIIGVATQIVYGMQNLACVPLLISLLPQDKYGQFSSANSMVNSAAVFFGAMLGGYFTDLYGYRVMFIWDFTITLLATFSLIIVYKEWKKYGGKANYQSPVIH